MTVGDSSSRPPGFDFRPSRFFVAGGTLDPDSPSYLVREADRQLYAHLSEGEYCYVLNSRQVGKSSLMTRIARLLEDEGVATATVDLSTIGGDEAGPWYFGVLYDILAELSLPFDLESWWEKRARQSPAHRFREAFSELVLDGTEGSVVIFVDEIDKTLELPFTDDFFGAIRGFYNARSRTPAFRRLSFVLLGVASPGELVKDARNTPFNVGVPIELGDFDRAQARPLLAGLGVAGDAAETALREVLEWTDGHPYLTQKLLKALSRLDPAELANATIEASVERLVEDIFLAAGRRRQEHNFDDIRRRLCSDPPELRRKQLKLYRTALRELPLRDEPQSLPVSRLKLTGLVKATGGGLLRVRNRIYARVFDETWVASLMPKRPQLSLVWGIPTLAIIAGCLWLGTSIYQVWGIRSAGDEVPLDQYRILQDYLVPRSWARAELARYWDRQADQSRQDGNSATELLQRLRALTFEDDEDRRYQVFLAEQNLENLEATAELPYGHRVLSVGTEGSWWITLDQNGHCKLWSRDAKQEIADLGPATASIFLPRSTEAAPGRLLTGNGEGYLSLWRLDVDPLLRPWTLKAHDGPVKTLALSHGGRWLATGSDRKVRLWRVPKDDREPERLPALPFTETVEQIAISGDGAWVASRVQPQERIVWLWRLDRQPPELSRLEHEARIESLAFAHDDLALLVGTDGQPAGSSTLLAWELSPQGVADEPKTLRRQPAAITALLTAPGTVAAGHSDGSVTIWNASSTRRADPLQPRIELEESYVLPGQGEPIELLALPSNARRAISGSRRGRISFWSLEPPSAQRLQRSTAVNPLVAFSPDSSRLVIGDSDGVVELWRLGRSEPRLLRLGASISSLAFHPAGRWLAAGSTAGHLQLQPLGADLAGRKAVPLYVSKSSVTALGFSAARDLLAAGSQDGQISLWRLGERPELSAWLSPPGKEIKALEVSPTDRWLKAERIDGPAEIWDLATRKKSVTLTESPRQLLFSTFDPEDRWLATSSFEIVDRSGSSLSPRIAVWNLKADALAAPATVVQVDEPIQWISFSADGRRVVTNDVEGSLQHWFWDGETLSDERRGGRFDLSRVQWPQSVRAAEFDHQDTRLLVYRDRWIHTYSSLDGGITWRESSVPYGFKWTKGQYRLANDTVRLADVAEDAVLVETVELLRRTREAPTSKLEDWQQKLALILRVDSALPEPWPRNW